MAIDQRNAHPRFDQALLPDPPVVLAPMAGITDLPFRRIVSKFGADLVVSEMVASKEMVQEKPSARARAALGLTEARTAVQIAGCDAYWMAEAARFVAANGAAQIDINMGCPAKKVVGGLSGSALMRDLDHAARLIEAVVAAVDVPVTLKTRLGWDDSDLNAPELARRAENAGIQMIAIHGRTRCQFYKGRANWGAINAVTRATNLPVIANGDIASPRDARTALAASGSAGVMVGRAALGRPWLLAQIQAALWGGAMPIVPQRAELADLVIDHYEMSLGFYGRALGARVIRKHLASYMAQANTPMDLRHVVLTAPAGQVPGLLRQAFSGQVAAA